MTGELTPETLAGLDRLMRLQMEEAHQYIEDRLAETKNELAAVPTPNGIELAGENATVMQRVQGLEVVGGQVNYDPFSNRGRITIPPPERDIFSLEFFWPNPATVDQNYRLTLPCPAKIVYAEIRMDIAQLAHITLQVGPKNAWPLRYLLGPTELAVIAPLATAGTLPLTELNTDLWNVHFLDRGDTVIATLTDIVDTAVDVHLQIDVMRLPIESNGLGALEVADGGVVLQGLPGEILVVRL